jgi:hypothetical protein
MFNQTLNQWISACLKRIISLHKGCRGCDRMVVGFTTACAISAYHLWCYEFESCSRLGVQHYVIKFVWQWLATGQWFSLGLPRYNWNIVESGIKHHKTKPTYCANIYVINPVKLYWLTNDLLWFIFTGELWILLEHKNKGTIYTNSSTIR